jgi:hypothetical protein
MIRFTVRRSLALLLPVVGGLLFSPAVPARVSVWTDAQGTSFKGEPTGILGPFAVFRSGRGGKRVLLRAFPREECVRLYRELAAQPPRAARFADAKAPATGDLVGKVQQVRDRNLEPANLDTMPEPELLLVLAGSNNSAEGWFMAGSMQQFYHRVRRVYPGLLEGVFLGARHDAGQHRNIALGAAMPWLVAEFRHQSSLGAINGFIPATQGANLVLVTRHGVPVVAGQGGTAGDVRQFVDQANELLWLLDPTNPAGWADRLHYLTSTRPVEFAQGEAPPLLIGNPLRADGLRKYGIKRVAARLAVAADGGVSARILSGPEDLPSDLAAPLAAALSKAVVAPAISRGRPVAGTLDYLLEVPPADPVRDAEHTWIASTSYPVLTIPDWLVLRPIPVPEKEFDAAVIGETADGTVIFNSVEVNTGRISRRAQLSAFNSDWFGETGAATVQPREGETQRINDEIELKWEKVPSVDGFVEMQTGIPKDYVVGYAWTEFDSPRDTEAWLGLGSDDGVKIWLNGELVHDKWIRRPSRVDDDVVPLRLKRGPNRILIKIQNATIHWSFMYRLRLKP